MSKINFPAAVNMLTTATPSSGWTIAYDLDGVLKQKDSTGVVSAVGSVYNQPLNSVLKSGNNSGTFSMIMGTATSISSGNGNSRISLDYQSQANSISISTNQGLTYSQSLLNLTQDTISISNYSNTGTVSLIGGWSSSISEAYSKLELSQNQNKGKVYLSTLYAQNNIELNDSESRISLNSVGGTVSLNVSNNEIRVIDNSLSNSFSGSGSKSSVFFGSEQSYALSGIYNSPVIGGMGLTAYSANTVYLGNSVNINNQYTLPSVDGTNGQVLKTNGSGAVTWGNDSAFQGLSDVLSLNNDSDTYDIIMGTGTSIKSSNSQNRIFLDRNNSNTLLISTDNGALTKTNIILDQVTATVSAPTFSIKADHSLISISDLQGLRYTADYSATFVTQSLVDKGYVDNKLVSLFSRTTAYVDVTYGNNSTALVNRFDKPYSTVAAATLGLTSSTPGNYFIYIRRGTYTEHINLTNNFTYYCEPGVLFTQNGFRDLSQVTADVLGYAKFDSTNANLVPLNLTYLSTVNFEFDYINNTNFAIKVENSTANIRGNQIYSRSDSSYAVSIRSNSTVRLDIKNYILSPYKAVSVSDSFQGTLKINCPVIESNSNGLVGFQTNTSVALFVDDGTSGTVEFKGNLLNSSETGLYTLADFATRYDGSMAILSGNVTMTGNINSTESKGLVVVGTYSSGQVRYRGDITSKREAIVLNSSIIPTYLSEGTLKSFGSGSYPYTISIIGTSSKFYLKNSTVWNSKNDSSLMYVFSTYSTVGIYDTIGYSPGTTGNFVYTTQSVNVGFHSVRSNKDNNILVTDLFGPSGFIYDENLFIPNI